MLLGHLTVTGQLADIKAVDGKTFREVSDHFLDERLHWSDVDHLEFVGTNRSVIIDVFADLAEDGQHGHIGLTSTGGSAKQYVFVRVQANLGQLALNAIESFEALESALSVCGQILNRNEL